MVLVALTGVEPVFAAFSCFLQVTENAIAGINFFAGISARLYKTCTGTWSNSVFLEGLPGRSGTSCYGFLRRLTKLPDCASPLGLLFGWT
jgi:hypothetical protein